MIQTHGRRLAGVQYARMGEDECGRIHGAVMEIMEHVGIEVHDDPARELLVKGGARADGIVVRVPEHMVARALDLTPKQMVLYDRNGQVAIRAWGYTTYYGGGSDCLNCLDHRTGEHRRALMQDVIDAQIVQHQLKDIDFVMSMFLPSDVNDQVYDRYQMQAMLEYTTKPIVFVSPDFEGCVAAVEMAEIVAGGAAAFQRRPFSLCYINVTSGTVANQESLQKCMWLAEKGLPQMYIPLNGGGTKAPCSTAAAQAAMCAGTLLGVVLAQLVREGSPVMVPGWSGSIGDLRNLSSSYCTPDGAGVSLSMGHYYGLPTFGLGGCSDAKVFDAQAGMEVMQGLIMQTLEGANMLHDLGFLEAGLLGSLPLLVMADDAVDWIRHAFAPVKVEDDDLALGQFHERGPGASYLDHPYTVKHFRSAYNPGLREHDNYSRWVEKGSTTLQQRAAQRVEKLLGEYKLDPLPEDIRRDLSRIVSRELAWAESKA